MTGSYTLSKIKNARRPARGQSYPCQHCKQPIRPGDQYFCYQVGQRDSRAYCLACVRATEPDPDTYLDDAHRIYQDKYGLIEGPPENPQES